LETSADFNAYVHDIGNLVLTQETPVTGILNSLAKRDVRTKS